MVSNIQKYVHHLTTDCGEVMRNFPKHAEIRPIS